MILNFHPWYCFLYSSCGYGTIHDVNTKELEDRMESFFLSETCKYLYLVSCQRIQNSSPYGP